ncbi:glycoside hydrolase family protein [Vibrio sp. AND4]|uniref:glycoside hydrolase family protein n=1 Tax=Vibrio sp. AND4 TaxID=314289 RepID=UPI00015F2BE6|nr:glycoside hydrolase family protein [Vibrio sp. AND4]EDP57962.1 lysozyme, putative [Vibrio sp. AND4]
MSLNKISLNVLKFEEGFSEDPYYCSEGYPTIGIGQKIGPKGASLHQYCFQCPISVAEHWCSVEIEHLSKTLSRYDWYTGCGPNRQAMLISMAYQMGVNGLLGFKKMLDALNNKDWNTAYMEGLDSLWAKQTPARANRQMTVIKSDQLDINYCCKQ